MAEPLTRSDRGGEGGVPAQGSLADASSRLQRALASLEAAIADEAARPVEAAPAEPPAYLAIELETSRWRERELQAAAAAASKALESAMAEVRRALQTEPPRPVQGALDLALESATRSPEEAQADAPSPQEDPAG